MKKHVVKKPEELPLSLRRRLVFGDEEQIDALQRTSIKIPDSLPILKKHVRIEVNAND
jgi:hypothetical protein